MDTLARSGTPPSSVAVIGAGITGSVCAHRLRAGGMDVHVFDKGRSVGGRMASRHITLSDGTTTRIDHGAQFAAIRDRETQQAFCDAGALTWFEDRLTGAPSIRAIPERLLQDICVSLSTEIIEIRTESTGVVVSDSNGQEYGPFDHAVYTLPAPQVRRLVPSIVPILSSVTILPCWALMAVFQEKWEVAADRFGKGDAPPPFSWVAREGAKPGRQAAPDRWIAHASPAWSTEHLEDEDNAVAETLMEALRALSAAPMPYPAHTSVHRWRYARTECALGQPFVATHGDRVMVAGDWCLGARIEAGFQSGRSVAAHLLGLTGK